MVDAVPQFVELLESELPEWLPRPEGPPGVDVAWFVGRRELEDDVTVGPKGGIRQNELEVYVWRAGDGGAPPFRVTLLAGVRACGSEGPGLACWPRLEDIWAALNETCLEGALFQLPAHIAGSKYSPALEGQAVTLVQAVQVGALAGSPAFLRWSIASKPAGVGLVQ